MASSPAGIPNIAAPKIRPGAQSGKVEAGCRKIARQSKSLSECHAAAVCVKSDGAVHDQRQRIAQDTDAGVGLDSVVDRCRRKARAPGTARNRPSMWRVIACSRVPFDSSRST